MSFLKKIKQSSFVLWGAIITFSLLFLGIKYGAIFHYGNAIPYWDQWDAEAANLYKPFLEGTLTWNQLIAPHNEHRILTTRLIALLLLKINGLWNPLLQMVVNGVLHLLALLLVFFMLVHALGKKIFLPLLLFMLVLFSVPFGWENILAGFQSQFYFVLIFSLLTLFFIIEKEPLSLRWWVGILAGLLACFSLASGVFALAAGAAVLGIQYFLGTARSLRSPAALLLLGMLVISALVMTPTILGHAPLKAHSVYQFISALMVIMSWPLRPNIFWCLLRNAPSIIFCGRFLFIRAPRTDRRWFLLGLVIWSGAQAMSIAYGRAVGCNSSRYLDLFAFSVLINFACLLEGFEGFSWKGKKIKTGILLIWIAVIFLGLFSWFRKDCYHELLKKRNESLAEEMNVNHYQSSKDIRDLEGKKFLEIPYPDPNRLALILSYPTIQQILPTCIHQPSQDGTLVQGRYDAAVNFLLAHYLILIEVGVLIALLLAVVLVFC